jgi:anti-sigma factor RsiW
MVKCEEVLRELSNFIDNDVKADLRAEIEAHLRTCHHCSVVADGVKKIVYIFADEKVFEIPSGYSERLHELIETHLK